MARYGYGAGDGRAGLPATRLRATAVVVAWVLAQPALAADEPPRADSDEKPIQETALPRDTPVRGTVHTWRDGDRTLRVRLQSGFDVADPDRGGRIVRGDAPEAGRGLPVFRAEDSGEYLTLPGGVLVALDPEWTEDETDAFFARNGIAPGRVSKREFARNAFFVQTAPGLPSLDLANVLARRDGVRIASPNWRQEFEAK